MNIGIIGSGNIGGNLTRRLEAVGHDVIVANSRGPQSLIALAKDTGATPGTVESAIRDTDLVVLALPLGEVPSLPVDAFRDRIVVDADNYYPSRDGDIPEISHDGMSSSRWTANQLPGATVVKVFNSIFAEQLLHAGPPASGEGLIALPVAADDPAAKRTVMEVVMDLGFDAVDAGSLDESWRQEPNTPVYGADLDVDGLQQGLSAAHR